MKIINLATDFTRFPTGRYPTDGKYSGELFRKKFLMPYFENNEHVVLCLDGACCGSSFLEEVFGGLVRSGQSTKTIKKLITIKANDTSLIKEINEYMI